MTTAVQSDRILRHGVAARFAMQPGQNVAGSIDYSRHPAYREAVQSTGVFQRVRATAVFARYFAVVVWKRLVKYELLPRAVRKPRSLSGWLGLVKWRARLAAAQLRKPPELEPTSAEGQLQVALRADGIVGVKLPPAEFAHIERESTDIFAELRRRRGNAVGGREFMESRASADQALHAALYGALNRAFESSGVLAAVSAYLGRAVRLVDINPQINDSSDDFWKHVFDDLAVPLPATAYLHKDASGGDVKAIVYMSDVGPENGPFGFVLGSHRERASRIDDWIAETNDHSGMSGTGADARRGFAALPSWFRQKCAFGNDLVDAGLASRLLASEWRVLAPRGSIVVFDTKGFHRGGMVRTGERLVVTCVLG